MDCFPSVRGAKRVALAHRAENKFSGSDLCLIAGCRWPKYQTCLFEGELASLLGISVRSLKRLEDRGLLKSSKALRTKIYSHREVMRFLDSGAIHGNSGAAGLITTDPWANFAY